MKKFILIFVVGLIALSSCETLEKQYAESHINSNEDLQEYLMNGWNTWNNSNLLSHVLMPEGLSIRISFRKTTYSPGEPYYLDHAYISSPHLNFPEQIEPLAHLYDGSYTDLRVSWGGLTARVQSAIQKGEIFILYTPEKLPENPPIMIIEVGLLWNKEGMVEKKSGYFEAEFGPSTINIGVTEQDSLIPLPLAADYITFRSDKAIGIFTGKKRSLEYIQEVVEKSESIAYAEKESYGEFAETYNAIQNLLAWNIIYDAYNDRAITPVSRVWNENWGGWVLFDWDTYFTAAMYAIDNKHHAFSNLIAISNEITDRGFIPNYSSALKNGKSTDRSQPPVGSLITKLIYDKYPEEWLLKEVYDKLLTWNRWWPDNRDNNGFLCWGSDPTPGIYQSGTKQGAMYESGLDNSPLFDDAVYNDEKHMLELGSVGLMSLYIADCYSLAEMAEILEKEEDVAELRERAEKYSRKLKTMWDEETGIYRDFIITEEAFSPHLAPTNFYPLIAGVPTRKQAEAMIQNYFMDPGEFYGEYMTPSISRSNPAFSDNSYWRGRIWAPMNFLVYLGLKNYELPEARKILSQKSNNLLLKGWNESRRVYENYNADTGEGSDVLNSDGFYSWGGLLGLITLMEEGFWDKPPEKK